ncbi:MAG: dihydroorotase family protein [Thermoplasmata archaeon]
MTPSRRPPHRSSLEGGRSSELASILAGRTWLGGKVRSIEIGIDEEGTIRAIGRSLRGAPRHDVGESLLLPSATDLHVHFRDPGREPDLEDFETGTLQAALGGVGLVADMPNTTPRVDTLDRLQAKEARARGRAVVDVLLYAAASLRVPIDVLAHRAGAFKLYLGPTTDIDEVLTSADLDLVLERVAATNLPLSVHAEDPERFNREIDPANPRDWNRARPVGAEGAAVDSLLRAPPGLRLHVAHVTEAAIAGRLREGGHSFEATPHHLLLSERSGDGPQFKVNPPLRSERQRQALWETFVRGEVPCLASDHAPHSATEKQRPFPLAPSGMPNVETMLPLLLARVRAGDLPLPILLAAACDRPARWIGQPRGRIAIGHRADLLVVDFRKRRTIAARDLHAPCGWTAFEGWEGVFPREHYLRGKRIVEGGEFVGGAGGRIVRPEFAPDPARRRPRSIAA